MKQNNKIPPPPGWATGMLRWFCAEHLADEIEGDLLEEFNYQASMRGVRYARIDYIRNVIGFMRPFAMKKRTEHSFDRLFMTAHYLRVGIRNLLRNKSISFINLFGLSVGLCFCMLLLLYTKDETSFDAFHEKSKDIYQLIVDRKEETGKIKHFAIAAMVQGPSFQKEIPEIETYVRVRKQFLTVKRDDHTFAQEVTWVDENFFSVFSFPLTSGQIQGIFSNIRSCVIAKETAVNFFGKTDVIGQTIDLEVGGRFETFVITGVIKEAPANSTIQYKILLPFKYLDEFQPDNGWHWVSFPTYFLLHPNAKPAVVQNKMKTVYDLQARQEIDEMKLMGYGDTFTWGLLPFTGTHLNSVYEGTPNSSDPLYAYILTAIALFILVVACINFVNLSVAQSLRRAAEIGVRKVLGGQTKQLAFQFLIECLLITSIAFMVAATAVQLLLPLFNELSHKNLSLAYLFDWKLVAGAMGLLIITSLLAGIYPSVVLSRLNPIETLQNRFSLKGNNYLGKSLVVLQFALSSSLIIGTAFIYQQFSFLTQTDLGYNDKNLLEITAGKSAMDRPLMRSISHEFQKVAGVISVAPRNIGKFGGPTKANNKEFYANYTHVDEQFIPTLGIVITLGRNFSPDFPADSMQSVVVNEEFVKETGWEDPIGHTVDFMNIPGWGDKKRTIIGVARNYHSESLREFIKPEIFTYEPMLPYGKFMVKIDDQNVAGTLVALESGFRRVLPNDPFDFHFKDDMNAGTYNDELRWKKIIAISCVATVMIACMGLLALTAYATERRSREIAVRKILGASSAQILGILCRNFLVLVSMGFAICIPAVYLAARAWLAGFAYHIAITPWIFLITGISALAIAFATISLQSLKAIFSSPANSLKNN